MKPKLVTCYVNPDLDGFAGAIAYNEFLQKTGKDSVVGIIGDPSDEVRYILDRFSLASPLAIENADNFNEVVLVDASDLNGLEGKISAEKVIEIIDHRKVHEADKFPRAKVQIELVGAAATLVAEKFMQNKIEISKESAMLLCGAIISNTLNFKGGVTTDRDKITAEWLNKVAKLPEDFWEELFVAKSGLIKNMGDKKVGIAQIEIIGAQKLVAERNAETIQVLDEIKKEMSLDFIFQNTIELKDAKNFFVTHDSKTQELLEKVLKVQFDGAVAERPNLIMRKQIVPLLKDELEAK